MLTENDSQTVFEDMPEAETEAPLRLLTDWTDDHSARFQKEIMTFGHDLAGTGLFTDEALIDLLERHPAELLDVCTMGASDDPLYPNKFRTGDFREVSGETLLKAARAGRVWINLRQAMIVHEDYNRVLNAMYGELAEKTGKKALNPKGGVLISSPVAKVPYHFDKTETLLWHVRGQKRMYIYPLTQDFISDKSFESALTNFIEDDLPYDPAFDEHARVVDIPENTALCWRLNAPHRVDNRTFCVSVTTEYSTAESGMKNAAMLTNATLRHRFGMNPSYAKDGEMMRKVKSVMGRAIRKAGLAPNTTKADMVTFKIDASAKDYIVDTDPYQRSF